jgi:HEAT repeat protein
MPALVDALASSEGPVRWSAAKHLVDMGRVHGEVLPVLLEYSVREPSRDARRMAIHALRELAPDQAETADALLTTTRDPDLVLRRASLAALASLVGPPPEIIERLVEVLTDDRDCASQRIAVTSLGELGATSGQRISPAIETRLRDVADRAKDPGLRQAATRALRRIAEAHPPHTP